MESIAESCNGAPPSEEGPSSRAAYNEDEACKNVGNGGCGTNVSAPCGSCVEVHKKNLIASTFEIIKTRLMACNKKNVERMSQSPPKSRGEDKSWRSSSAPVFSSPKKQQKPNMKLQVQSAMIPHPSKKQKGGEDAFFVAQNGKAIGVADGVGGWADKGIDPSLYARTLMSSAKQAIDEHNVEDPREMLKMAALKANKTVGSSTACILSLDDANPSKAKLRSANLGDSGYLVLREGSVCYRTKEQQFDFNFPYQLGPNSRAKVKDADVAALDVKVNDIIVMGTDGLFDNLFDHEIVDCIATIHQKWQAVQLEDERLSLSSSTSSLTCVTSGFNLAETLAQAAHDKAKSPRAATPFARNAHEHGHSCPGGKLDDITVLVAQVVLDSEFSESDEDESDGGSSQE